MAVWPNCHTPRGPYHDKFYVYVCKSLKWWGFGLGNLLLPGVMPITGGSTQQIGVIGSELLVFDPNYLGMFQRSGCNNRFMDIS